MADPSIADRASDGSKGTDRVKSGLNDAATAIGGLANGAFTKLLHGVLDGDGDTKLLERETEEENDEGTEEESRNIERRNTPLAVNVEWHDFEHFKNRYSPDQGLAIIEVLRGHQHIGQEVARELVRREEQSEKTSWVKPAVGTEPNMMQRIRIQSPGLIRLLSRLTGNGDSWDTKRPRIFFQPFRMFYHYLPQVKKCQRLLEANWPSTEADETPDGADVGPPKIGNDLGEVEDVDVTKDDASSDDEPDNDPLKDPALAVTDKLVNSPTTLNHIRKYVEFVEDQIAPHWKQAAGTTKRKFRFNDLWMSFQLGELLYVPPEVAGSQDSDLHKEHTKMYQNAWRLYAMSLDAYADEKLQDTQKTTNRDLDIHAYYIDYDGSSFVPVSHTFTIKDYEGEKEITSQIIYPMRFAKDAEKIKTNLQKQGQRFLEAIQLRHLYYNGWTLTRGPTGLAFKPEPNMEHIEGEIIIDFMEGFENEASLGPGPSDWPIGLLGFDDSNWPITEDELTIRNWETLEDGQLRVADELVETAQRGEWYCHGMQTKTLRARSIPRAHTEKRKVTDITDDDLLLLPRRVVAYAFRERKFHLLDIQSVEKIPVAQNAFEDLKIEKEYKHMVKSLVKSHLETQASRKGHTAITLNQDLIHGKGSGLVILLHGVPGVGKTATAEAVAQANEKPLFSITCGDLGFAPKGVETNLRGIFRLAHHWGCVLLLDEADIFLSRRELGDLKRNALVSVFLRVLEYYSGILFLTTNRVGTFDEAFKSRIHLSLYYPPLTKAQTLAIFDVNIRRLAKIEEERQKSLANGGQNPPKRLPVTIKDADIKAFAEWHYDVHEDTPEQRWNGRQIRNSFQIAYSLAQFGLQESAHKDDQLPNKTTGDEGGMDVPVILDGVHFNKVAETMEKFEDYLYSTAGGTDKDRARKSHIREDDFDPYQRQHTLNPHPPQPRWRKQTHPGYSTPQNRNRGHPNGQPRQQELPYSPWAPQTPSNQRLGFSGPQTPAVSSPAGRRAPQAQIPRHSGHLRDRTRTQQEKQHGTGHSGSAQVPPPWRDDSNYYPLEEGNDGNYQPIENEDEQLYDHQGEEEYVYGGDTQYQN